MTAAAVPPRPVTVPEDLWAPFNRVLYDAGLNLVTITSTPNQAARYEVRHRKVRRALPDIVGLSEREAQILAGMATGLSNGEIGQQLDISLDTVKTHARRMFRKLGARDRANAVAIGYQRGLLGAPVERHGGRQ
jgi:ATP/maltotriose-dependent transcriptional regulator MalT